MREHQHLLRRLQRGPPLFRWTAELEVRGVRVGTRDAEQKTRRIPKTLDGDSTHIHIKWIQRLRQFCRLYFRRCCCARRGVGINRAG
jgi:hypothetical protein